MKKVYLLYCLLVSPLTLQANGLKDISKIDKNFIKTRNTITYIKNVNSVNTNLSLSPTNGILYVKKGATGNGSSWENAAGELADALKWANDNKSNFSNSNRLKIYVAKGTYKPMYTPQDGQNFTDTPRDNRDKTFLMVENVDLIGGFDPENGIRTEQDRRILPNNTNNLSGTILSGDIENNDVISKNNGITTINNTNDNTYHVVLVANKTTAQAKIDGFTITGGNSHGPSSVIFVNNSIVTKSGGSAIYLTSDTSSTTLDLQNSNILNNTGSSIYTATSSDSSTINLLNSVIKENYGAGIYAYASKNSTTKLVNSVLSNNYAENGSAIYTESSSSIVKLINSNLVENIGNSAIQFNFGTSNTIEVENSIVYNNKTLTGSNFVNPSDWINIFGGQSPLNPIYKYSFVQGNTNAGDGNILTTVDPLFIDAANGNYQLQWNSPLIDNGNLSLYPYNASTDRDIIGNRRLFGNKIDIGAFERYIVPGRPTIVLAIPSDTGFSDSDKLTKLETPVFEGYATPNSTVTVYDTDKTTVLGTTTADSQGKWSLTSTKLIEGVHEVYATSKNQYGDESDFSEPEIITVDLTRPRYTNITRPDNGYYHTGDVLTWTMTFSEPVYNPITNPMIASIRVNNNLPNGQVYQVEGTFNEEGTVYTVSLVVTDEMEDLVGVTLTSWGPWRELNDIAGNPIIIPTVGGPGTPSEIYIDKKRTSDVGITITASTLNAKVGDEVTYTITVNNSGIINAENVNVNSIFPNTLDYSNSQSNTGSYNRPNGTWTESIPTMIAGETKVFVIKTIITQAGQILVNANAETSTYETNKANNTASVTVNATKKDQVITWNQQLIVDCNGAATMQLAATTSSGLPITYKSTNEAIARVNGNELTITGLGNVNIIATQPGNNEYNAAVEVSNLLTQYLKGVVKQKWDDVLVFDNTSNDYVSYQWYKDGVAINGATKQSYQAPQKLSGSYHAVVTDKNGVVSQTCPLVIYANNEAAGIKTVPNPVYKGSNVKFLANYSEDELRGARYIISDLTGKTYKEVTNVNKEISIQAPTSPGVYIVNLFLVDGRKASTKILVN